MNEIKSWTDVTHECKVIGGREESGDYTEIWAVGCKVITISPSGRWFFWSNGGVFKWDAGRVWKTE
jgi:hypothetical protein